MTPSHPPAPPIARHELPNWHTDVDSLLEDIHVRALGEVASYGDPDDLAAVAAREIAGLALVALTILRRDASVVAPAEPSLSAINDLAKTYASSYASPHHITFTVEGLRNLLAALSHTQLVAPSDALRYGLYRIAMYGNRGNSAQMQKDIDAALLAEALQPSPAPQEQPAQTALLSDDLCDAYGVPRGSNRIEVTDGANFSERCRIAQECLPDAQYRERLNALHDEMLAAIGVALGAPTPAQLAKAAGVKASTILQALNAPGGSYTLNQPLTPDDIGRALAHGVLGTYKDVTEGGNG